MGELIIKCWNPGGAQTPGNKLAPEDPNNINVNPLAEFFLKI